MISLSLKESARNFQPGMGLKRGDHMNLEERKQSIITDLRLKSISEGAALFFIFLESKFQGNVPFNSKPSSLASEFGKSERSVRSYTQELKEAMIIRVVPTYKYGTKSKKRYVDYNTYHLLEDAITMISKAEAWADRRKTVFFETEEDNQQVKQERLNI